MSASPKTTQRQGLLSALGAYVIWGFLPLYLILVKSVPAFEFVAWRIIWTLPLCLIFILLRSQWGELRAAVTRFAVLRWLMLSALLIGTNWLVYIWAVQTGEIYAASLGYYINPLLNILLGTMLLGERLSRLQWVAVAVAAFGVTLLLGGAFKTLWISMVLACSFGTYGLVRRRVPVGALPGLTIESALLLLPSAAIALAYAQGPQGSSFGQEAGLSALIMAGGVLTAVPLIMFAVAARRLPYSTLGFIQFLSPSIVFVLGLTVWDKPLKGVELACFACIWVAAAIFAADLIRAARASSAS